MGHTGDGRGALSEAMLHRIEALAAERRRQLGIDTYPGLAGLLLLIDYLKEQVRFIPTPGAAQGYCRYREGGCCTIWADPCRADLLGHELGHALLCLGLADWLASQGVPTARLQGFKEERLAWLFARAFLIPPGEVRDRTLSNEEVADLAGVPVWMVADRRRDLRVH